MLSQNQLREFEDNGYLVIPDFLSKDEVEVLQKAALGCAQEFNPTTHPLVKFTTGDGDEHIGDDYFLESGDKIRYFLERDAVNSSEGGLLVQKDKAINKIGHGFQLKLYKG
ncbi:hypothetical protein DSO57_1032400 [Entomophthora muscae]|uniref:Uncharacterized protein n=1 Tax=Entomophthora muscae TaxID=34485 RepID=A0ACC2RRB9_9FUNG|nr:hypothetical protein DSO57_1032400 [Entomophthora muscae]